MARVTLFGRLQDAAGWRERVIEADTLSGLRAALIVAQPELDILSGPGVFAVIDHATARGDHPLKPDTEVAFIPPVSGG